MLEAPTACWSSWFHLLITLFEKKYLQQSRVHRNLTIFQECPLVPLMLLSEVKSSFNLSLDNPVHILKTSIRSCLFLLSASVHNFKQSNVSSYVTSFRFTWLSPSRFWLSGSARYPCRSTQWRTQRHGRGEATVRPIIIIFTHRDANFYENFSEWKCYWKCY